MGLLLKKGNVQQRILDGFDIFAIQK